MTSPLPSGPSSRATDDSTHGVLLVDKPPCLTSHDVVNAIRRQFRFEKVGHGGTLDPQATGLLIVMIGRATKLSNLLMAHDKTYEGVLRLGIATDSHDADGKVTGTADPSHITREQLLEEMKKFTGDVLQTPPMVSAIKKNGVPLYKLARKGKTVERQPKLIHVYAFDLLDYSPPHARFHLECTKGVYVRTICADIGAGLGCGAHLEQLRRTRSGNFSVDKALPLDTILKMDRPRLLDTLIPLQRLHLQGDGA
ncbi:MAG: tRNA pseudouridine(55) synthase TruB [Lentisphaerae bacterium]|nr:tRNA pseudouridine(55) synthase TruB [Lentisphaerota bacterium]